MDVFVFFNDTATTEIYTLSLHDALPISTIAMVHGYCIYGGWIFAAAMDLVFAAGDALFLPSNLQYFTAPWDIDRKSTRLNSSHANISYAVFCLKKKK